ncbi:MAG: hypothetical protein WCD76_08995 [Pyrinomonadaceae bacterium]
MKNLRQLSVAVAFTFALAVPVFAGQIDTPVVPPPSAPAAIPQGEIHTTITGQAEETSATDSVAQAALNLLQSVLSLF